MSTLFYTNESVEQRPRRDVHPGTYMRAYRAEALKSTHGAPLRLAILTALPFAAWGMRRAGFNERLLAFMPWNFYYMLMLPVMLVVATASVASYDARLNHHALLSSGVPLSHLWAAKLVWCLTLSCVGNAIMFCVYAVGARDVVAAPSIASLGGAAITGIITTAWVIPVTLGLTARVGTLTGIIVPLVIQIVGSLLWSIPGLSLVFPPTASAVVPSAFLPIAPSGEPLEAGMALTDAIGQVSASTWVSLGVAVVVFVVLSVLSIRWFCRSEELS